MEKILFLVIVLLQVSCNDQNQKINGLSFVASRDSITQQHIAPVLKSKSNFVAIMPFGAIRNLSSSEIRYNANRQWFGETAIGVEQYAKKFQAERIKVMLKPQLWVWEGQYTGYIAMESEEKWKKLEDSYLKFILFYAEIAEKIQVDIFCIGTELEQFVMQRPNFWIDLIPKVRVVYKGKLTYAANWDVYNKLSFWSELDFIGVDAYFPLSEKKSPTLAELEIGWKAHKDEIMQVQKQFGKPILFTEFGYRSIDFATKEPWKSDRVEGRINLENQVNGLKAIHNQFWKEDWFAGGFIWKWFHEHKSVGGENNNRFTPQNKPAEVVLTELYGG